ncbi:MAG: hypothetical protein HY317_00950 [Acidobacteria bacterium]|nr:hypothetical protein [Acidobacteriota bacterium]
MRRIPVAVLAGLSACVLLGYDTAARRSGDLASLRTPRRFWEDVTVAASHHLDRGDPRPVPTATVAGGAGADLRHAYQRYLSRVAGEAGVRPWQFWRTVPVKPFLDRGRVVLRHNDDPGRALLLGAGFRLLGGVAPYLGLWLGTLAAMPVLAWIAWELATAGRPVAAMTFPLALVSLPFVVEVLSLPYSAVGFYLVGLLTLVPLAAHALLGDPPTPRSLLVRAAAAGLVFACCVLCRGGTILLLPGYALALILGARRAAAGPSLRVVTGLAALGLVLLLAPYAVVRQPGHHEAWVGIWEGLGDFDREKGHAWFDPEARNVLRREGHSIPRVLAGPTWTADQERTLRRLVLRHVAEDPSWYAAILAKRLVATATLSKLWPFGPRDGLTMAPSTSANEGVMDVYYRLTTTADFVGLGGALREVPVELLLLPPALLAGLWWAGPRTVRFRDARARLGPALLLLGCVACAALTLPVAITTASALEAQCFAVVHLLALALLVDEAARGIRRRASASA